MDTPLGTVIVAGATGLIGRKLTSSLVESRTKVVVLTRSQDAMRAPVHPLVRYVRWDGKNQGEWTQYVESAEAIVNLSGQSIGEKRWSETRKQELLLSRTEPTGALVEAIRHSSKKPKALVNASAVGFYGNVPRGNVVENHPPGQDFLGRTCVAWESSALEAQELGVRVVLLRSGIVLDSRGGALKKMLLPFRLFVGGPLGSGDQWFPWIHHEDEVRAIRFALDTTALSGALNLAAPQATTMRDFAQTLGAVMHRPSIFPVPSFVLRAILGEMSAIVLNGQCAKPEKLLKAGFEFRFPALTGALKDILG
ncbi:MAG: TIGR01777 family oxidoreductase [Ignavibacteriales bacterium]|nr:TIGR01777 family oxidoreductase [Ignavibacteriales bacterium]